MKTEINRRLRSPMVGQDEIHRYRGLRSSSNADLARRWLIAQLASSSALEWAKVICQLDADELDGGGASWLVDAGKSAFADPIAFQYVVAVERRSSGQPLLAEAGFRAILQVAPTYDEVAFALAELLREQGRLDGAVSVLRALVAQPQPPTEDVLLRSAIFMNQCQRVTDALSTCELALSLGLSSVQIHFLAADLCMSLGRFDDARLHLKVVIEANDPAIRGSALEALAGAQRYTAPKHPDFELFKSALADVSINGQQRAAVLFALGKAYDDIENFGAASACWREANAWVKEEKVRWSPIAWRRFIDQQIQEPMPKFAAPVIEDFVPVFVVGLPRSGTTLVSQLLAQNQDIRVRGELNWLPYIWQQLSFAGLRQDIAAIYQASRLYYTHVRQDDQPARWYVDKHPLNFRYLNLVVSMFPAAKVIHCRRDPRDAALSIFGNHFAEGNNEFSYDFNDIAVVAETAETLMEHWKRSLPLAIHTVDYEALVQNPEETLRSLAEFLEWPQSTLLSKVASSSPLSIATSSRWQARQPIYQRSVGRARAYRAFLPELDAVPM